MSTSSAPDVREPETPSAAGAEEAPPLELDLRGAVCPSPTTDTLARLKELGRGERMVVVCDYLPARQTIPRLLEERACSWEITDDDGVTFRMEIMKGDD